MTELIQRLGRDRQNLPDGAGPAPAAAAQGGEVGLHAGLDLADIGLRDLGPYRHRRQLGDPQDQRGALLCVQGLPLTCIDSHHRATDRGVDARVAKLGLCAAQCGLCLEDLRLIHVDTRLGRQHLGLGRLDILFARGAVGGHPLLATQLLFGQDMLGALLLDLRFQGLDGIALGIQPGLLRGRVDFHQQLPLLDGVAYLDVQGADLPGGLRADIDVLAGLQGAQSGDAGFDVATADTDGRPLIGLAGQQLPGGECGQRDQAQH
ncbi:hypothetical protein D3C79_785160 [compost metagenome]